MVIIYGNPLKKAYTYGREVGSIFCNRTEVWPKDVPVPEPYYIQWTPILYSGTFSMGGVTYNFSDYPNGVFYMSDSVITESAFYYEYSIQTIDTNALNISSLAFFWCSSLSQVSLHNCSYIGRDAFNGCRSLSQVYLGSDSVCILEYTAFRYTPITSSTGSIYVPSSLVSAYQSASNWSRYSNRIFPIQ